MRRAGLEYDPVGTGVPKRTRAATRHLRPRGKCPTGSVEAMRVAGSGDCLDGIAIPERVQIATGRVATLIRRPLDLRFVFSAAAFTKATCGRRCAQNMRIERTAQGRIMPSGMDRRSYA